MATAMAATRSVYESPGVRFCKRGGQFSVRAETDLDVGALEALKIAPAQGGGPADEGDGEARQQADMGPLQRQEVWILE